MTIGTAVAKTRKQDEHSVGALVPSNNLSWGAGTREVSNEQRTPSVLWIFICTQTPRHADIQTHRHTTHPHKHTHTNTPHRQRYRQTQTCTCMQTQAHIDTVTDTGVS